MNSPLSLAAHSEGQPKPQNQINGMLLGLVLRKIYYFVLGIISRFLEPIFYSFFFFDKLKLTIFFIYDLLKYHYFTCFEVVLWIEITLK